MTKSGSPSFLLTCGCTLALLCLLAVSNSQAADDAISDFFGGGNDLTLPGTETVQQADPELTSQLQTEAGIVTWSISIDLPPKGYVYSMNPAFGGGTKVTIEKLTGLEPIDEMFQPDHEPKKLFDVNFEQDVEKFFKKVTWTRRFRLQEGASPADARIEAQIKYQVCDDKFCRTFREPITVALAETETAFDEPALTSFPAKYEVSPYEVGSRFKPVNVRADLRPATAKVDEIVELAITLTVQPGWHVYSTTMEPDNAGIPTSFQLHHLQGLEVIDKRFRPSRPATPKVVDLGDAKLNQEIYENEITWTRRFKVQAGYPADTHGFGLIAEVNFQVCDDSACLAPNSVPFALGMSPDSMASELGIDMTRGVGGAPLAALNGSSREASTSGSNADPKSASNSRQQAELAADNNGKASTGAQGLVPFIIAAVTAGFLALLTPCVFPMIPITVSFFLKQSEKEHHRPVRMATVYCLGIIFAFTCIGLVISVLFGATQLTQIANNPWLNVGIAAVLIFFAANMLGMFEIRLPSGLLTWTAGKEGAGGLVGTLFMALTFTLVSFTCTFAFVGGLLVAAANGEYYWPIIGMMAFSAAFASPFFFLALFPSLLKKLPKSGGWMNRVKVTMGFVELGAALKFLSVADLTWNPDPVLFDQSLVLTGWLVLCIVTGLYLLNLFRLPHDSPADHISVPQLMISLGFLGMAGYLTVGLFAAHEPQGGIWKQIVAFAPPRIVGAEGDIGPYVPHGDLKFALDYEQAVEYARINGKPLLFDFTGVNCVNCRLMEKKMELPQNQRELKNFVLVQLYQDTIPTIKDRALADRLLEKNQNLAVNWFKDVTLPAYAVVTPDGEMQLASFKGLEQNDGAFAEFLQTGYARWKDMAGDRLTSLDK